MIHQLKESAERLTGLRLRRRSDFPYLGAARRFMTVRMDLHNKCNLRCRMCYFALDEVFKAKRVEMSERVLERVEREIWPRAVEAWLSCATEPLLDKRLGQVLRRAKRAGVPRVQLVSNAVTLTEPLALDLIEGGLDVFNLSLDGATAETYEKIRVGASFERVLGNIRRFQALKQERGLARPALVIRAVMMAANIGEWEALVHLSADLGAERLIFAPQIEYTEMLPEERLGHHAAAVNAALAAVRAASDARRLPVELPREFSAGSAEAAPADAGGALPCSRCLSPWVEVVIYPHGEIVPCVRMFQNERFGNLEEADFADFYYGPQWAGLRGAMRSGDYHAVCRDCPAGIVADLNERQATVSKSIF